MSHFPPPLRFLALVVGLWAGFRIAVLVPEWAGEEAIEQAAARPANVAPAPTMVAAEAAQQIDPVRSQPTAAAAWIGGSESTQHAAIAPTVLPPAPSVFATAAALLPPPVAGPVAAPPPGIAQIFPPAVARAAAPGERRWAASAWLLVREEVGGGALAPGGTLGGSQAGARVTWRLNRDSAQPLALSARIYSPLDRPEGAEAAVGLDWRPFAGLPLHLLAERREALGREGRSDFSLTLHGGTEQRLARGRVRVEAYGQAGLVGHRDPDAFADGLVRATAPLGPVELGGGLWGGAQPGASRLDAGPHLSARLRAGGAAVLRLMAEWRFRLAGDAAPGSGPALTLAGDF